MMCMTKLKPMENVQIVVRFIVNTVLRHIKIWSVKSNVQHDVYGIWKYRDIRQWEGEQQMDIFKTLLSGDAKKLPEVGTRTVGRSPLIGEADECSLAQDATRGVVSSSSVGVVLVPDRETEPA